MSASAFPAEKLTQFARTALQKTLGVKKGESVLIEAWTNTLPYAEVFQLEARRMGAKPLILFDSEPGYWQAVSATRPQELGTVGRAEWAALENADAYVYFWGPSDRPRLDSLPDKTREALTAYNAKWYKVTAKKHIRACRIELALAEPPNAAQMGVDFERWREELMAASLIDPTTLAKYGGRFAGPLEKGRRLRITHPNGTDLVLGLKHRKAIVDDARIDANDLRSENNVCSLPGGNLLLALDESVAEGTLIANRPSRFDRIHTTHGGRWEFRDGKLADYKFEEGQEHFLKGFQKAPKGKEKPGILEIGLNPAVQDSPNWEDEELGVVTVYIGGNARYGGATKIPYLSYLMVRGATLEVDGKTLLRGGVPVPK